MFANMFKNKFEYLVRICQKGVDNFGQQYVHFGIFGIINYPLSYIYRVYYANLPETESIYLRGGAALLCLPLILHNKVPVQYKKYLPLYWYSTLIFSIPFLGTYLLISNHFSLEWIINMGVGLFILIMIVDWFVYLFMLFIGAFLASIAQIIVNGQMQISNDHSIHYLGIYLYLCIFVFGVLFSRNKQNYQTDVINLKNMLNDQLRFKVEKKSQQLLSALERNKHFLRNFSHELRTPIHNIIGLSEQLKHKVADLSADRVDNILSMIITSTYSLSEVVNNVIDLSFYTSPNVAFNFTKFDFKELIRSCVDSNKIILECRNKEVLINLDYKAKREIQADAVKIKQVVNNFLSNAIKYMRPDSKSITIIVRRSERGYLLFTIKDDGFGIPEGEEKVIFNAFVRSSSQYQNSKGKGLGLSIVKAIIKGHRGKVWAESSNSGACFNFIIPIEQVKDDKRDKKRARYAG